jgi:hypothetical protein
MTDPTSDAIWLSGFTVLSAAERETYASHSLEAFKVALEATKLAIEAANEAPRGASIEHPTVPQIFEQWAAANTLVIAVFENLYRRAYRVIEATKPMAPTD